MNGFGLHLRKLRESKGMTVNQLAMYSDISAAQLSRIENGKRGVPKPHTIKKIADALKESYEELMTVAGYIDEHATAINENDFSPETISFLEQFESLPDEKKQTILDLLELYRSQKSQP